MRAKDSLEGSVVMVNVLGSDKQEEQQNPGRMPLVSWRKTSRRKDTQRALGAPRGPRAVPVGTAQSPTAPFLPSFAERGLGPARTPHKA